jgi:C-terminal processing protease CtpA/Prc
MKRRITAITGIALGMFCLIQPCMAQEEPKKETKTEAIVVTGEGASAEEVEKKIKEALEKAGVSLEKQERILNELGHAKNAAKGAAKDAKEQLEKLKDSMRVIAKDEADMLKNAKESAERIKDRVRNQVKGLNINLDDEAIAKGLNTRVLRLLSDQKYRIGVRSSVAVDEDGEDASSEGLLIDDVLPESPAAKAGIKADDVLIKVDGEALKSIEQLTKAVQTAGKDGKELSIDLKRGDESLTIRVKPAEMKDMDAVVEDVTINMPQAGWLLNRGQDLNAIRFRELGRTQEGDRRASR